MVKNPPSNAGYMGSIPESRRFPGEGNENPLQYSCLENSMDREAWQATVYGVAKESDMKMGREAHTPQGRYLSKVKGWD